MPDNTKDALDELTERRFGMGEFLIDQDGNPIHIESVFTVRLRPGESMADFCSRAKIEGIIQHNDRLSMRVEDGKTDYVRITRPAK